MKTFTHISARTVDEAIAALTGFGGRAVVNAGGTDLLGLLKSKALPTDPEIVINLKTISGTDPHPSLQGRTGHEK